MSAPAPRRPGLRETMERYGTVAAVVWFSIFFGSVALFAGAIHLGLDVDGFVRRVAGLFGADGAAWASATAGGGKLALAYLATQAIKPLRIALFLVATPVAARLWGRAPAPPVPPADGPSGASAGGEG